MNMKNVSFTKLREGKWHVCTRFAGSAVDNALGCEDLVRCIHNRLRIKSGGVRAHTHAHTQPQQPVYTLMNSLQVLPPSKNIIEETQVM